jgi:Chaperone of endosialidase
LAGINLTIGSHNIDIGNRGVAGDSGKIRIGTKDTQNGTFIAGISGVAVSGRHVVVNEDGRLGVVGSSAHFKEQIKPMEGASEAILALQPVTFRYKEELDPAGIPQFGLIAEEVEKIAPDLVVYDNQGKLSSVRYEAVNAMLLNEFLKEHRTVNDLEQIVKKQQAIINGQQNQIDGLTDRLEKLSDELADVY